MLRNYRHNKSNINKGFRGFQPYSQKIERMKQNTFENGYSKLLEVIKKEEEDNFIEHSAPEPEVIAELPKPTPREKKQRVKRTYTATRKDITTHALNKTENEIKLDEEEDEINKVDDKLLQEVMRPLRSGEELYNKLVKKTKRKRIPKAVRRRAKELKEIQERNAPKNVVDAIYEM